MVDHALPQLAAFDLDGTLLNSAKQITARTEAAVRALSSAGCLCVLASGRMYRDCMAPYVEQLGLETPVIAYNGGMVLSPRGEVWFEEGVTADLAKPVLDHIAASGQHLNFYYQDVMYCQRPNASGDLYLRRTGARPVYREDLLEWAAGIGPTKLLIVDDPGVIAPLCLDFQSRLGSELYITTTEREYLEFMSPRVNKGAALLALCGRLGIDPLRTVAFGDAPNDVPLLQAAGLGYAMCSARPEALAVADAVAPSNDEDGVAQVIEDWLASS